MTHIMSDNPKAVYEKKSILLDAREQPVRGPNHDMSHVLKAVRIRHMYMRRMIELCSMLVPQAIQVK